ncbi:MerR family transcriptional regulator [Konateibacter massiliensis]|uniref:MerR family transcriptional regulator n=1 Tax=Konateibacter massiliensis TaxID=2002841 RepID=UPI000C1582CD|nr:MerR family transcriptional regulator [Konateibacter massiliensis]
MLYTIRDAAAHVGIAASTLRYYDKEGLLPFVERSSGGIRMFGEADIDWLQLIECLKATGMSIKDIKKFIDLYMEGDSTLEPRRDMFYERKQAVEKQMEALQKTLDFIKYKCWFYDTSVAAGSSDIHKSMKQEDIPEEIQEMKLNAGIAK